MATEDAQVMIVPGMFADRIVRGIRRHEPNRFGDDDCDDLTGYIALDGKRTPVETGFWGDAGVWQLARDNAEWPICPRCDARLDIGSALNWQCGACGYSRSHK